MVFDNPSYMKNDVTANCRVLRAPPGIKFLSFDGKQAIFATEDNKIHAGLDFMVV
jgi:hypothetical protein